MATRIVFYSETIDNWGRQEASSKAEIIQKVLNDVDNWTDDMRFEDESGNSYFIDDLAGKEVELEGIGIITVPTE